MNKACLLIIMCISLNGLSADGVDLLERTGESVSGLKKALVSLYRKSGGMYARKEWGIWIYSDGSCDFWRPARFSINSVSPANPPDPEKQLLCSAHTHPASYSPYPSLADKHFINRYTAPDGSRPHMGKPMIVIHPLKGVSIFFPDTKTIETGMITASYLRNSEKDRTPKTETILANQTVETKYYSLKSIKYKTMTHLHP